MQALPLWGVRSDTRTENRGFIPFEVKHIEVVRGKRILDKRLDLCDVLLVDSFGAQRSSAARDGIMTAKGDEVAAIKCVVSCLSAQNTDTALEVEPEQNWLSLDRT